MTIYDSFMWLDQQNSIVQRPNTNEFEVGGHAMVIIGYNLDYNQFLATNSFGTNWGDQGYCWIPFDYVNYYVFEKWIFDI